MGEVWQGLLPCASPVWVNRHVEKTYHQSGSDGWYELVVTIGGSTTARWDSAVPKAHPTAAVDSPTSVTSGRDAPHLNAGWQIGARSVACHERNYMTRKAHSWQTSRRVVTRSGTATNSAAGSSVLHFESRLESPGPGTGRGVMIPRNAPVRSRPARPTASWSSFRSVARCATLRRDTGRCSRHACDSRQFPRRVPQTL